MNEPIVYKTKHCAILSLHFSIYIDGEGDYLTGGGRGVGKVVGRALGEAVAANLREDDPTPEEILTNQSVSLAEAYNSLIEEGWIPQSTGFGGAGAGRTTHNHGYIFIQIFTKPKEKVKEEDEKYGL